MATLVVNSLPQGWQKFSPGAGGGTPSEVVAHADAWNGAEVQLQRRDKLTADLWTGPIQIPTDAPINANTALTVTCTSADEIQAVVVGAPTGLYVVVKSYGSP